MESPSVNPRSRPARRKLASPRAQLDRGNWIESAIDVLARDGLGGLRIEVLAKRCGVTKGSFYWHFKDRRDLLDEVLALWKDGRIRDIYEMGKSLQEGYGEVQEMIDICDFAVGLSRQLHGLTMHSERPGHRMYEQYHPIGITGVISSQFSSCCVELE